MSSEKEKIEYFKGITNASDSVAKECLKANKGNLEAAVDYYFANSHKFPAPPPPPAPPAADTKSLEKIFDKYAAEKKKDLMEGDKLQKFFEDIKVDPQGVGPLLVAWKLQANAPAQFSRQEFVKGFKSIGADTTDKIQKKVTEMVASLSDRSTFRDFYRWLFNFARDSADAKALDMETATDLWNTVFSGRWDLLEAWTQFMHQEAEKAKSKKGGIKAISRDIWEQVFEFSRDVKPDLSNFELDGAWPGVIDEFAAFVKAKKAKVAEKAS